MSDHIAPAVAIKGGGDLVGTGVLPDDGVPVRLAGDRIPDHRRLALVGDTEACKISGRKTSGREGLVDNLLGTLPDLERDHAPPIPPWA